jgi:hypothetical protein
MRVCGCNWEAPKANKTYENRSVRIGYEKTAAFRLSSDLSSEWFLYPCEVLFLTGSSRVASLISTFVSPVRLTTIAVTWLGACNDERLGVIGSSLRNVCKGREMLRLDYVSCILTIISTVLIGKKLWQGWVIAGANSIIICVIGMRSAQFGFVPANLFCIGL